MENIHIVCKELFDLQRTCWPRSEICGGLKSPDACPDNEVPCIERYAGKERFGRKFINKRCRVNIFAQLGNHLARRGRCWNMIEHHSVFNKADRFSVVINNHGFFCCVNKLRCFAEVFFMRVNNNKKCVFPQHGMSFFRTDKHIWRKVLPERFDQRQSKSCFRVNNNVRFLWKMVGNGIHADSRSESVKIRKPVSHDEDIVAVIDNCGNRPWNQSGFNFVAFFNSRGNTAEEFILRIVSDSDLIAAAALRHVQRLLCRLVWSIERRLFSNAYRKCYTAVLSVVAHLTDSFKNWKFICNHFLQRAFLNKKQHSCCGILPA